MGSVAAQVQKLSQEQCKTQKCVDVAKLIAKAKDIDEAMHREIDKGAKGSKASHHTLRWLLTQITPLLSLWP